MNNFKRIIATICSGVIVGLIIFTITSHITTSKIECDYPYYTSLKKAVKASNLIVEGIIISDNGSSLIDAGAGEMKYHTYNFQVTECIKGNKIEEEIITIKILETTDNNIDDLLEEGKEYICFLQSYENGIPASLINTYQSTLLINGNDLVVSYDEKAIVEKSFDKNIINYLHISVIL